MQLNGVLERQYIILVVDARSMFNFTDLLLYFWVEAVEKVCFVQNKSTITKRLNKTPHEGLNNFKPNISFFYIFGCMCFFINNKDQLKKFEPKLDEGIFLGYSTNKVAYKVLIQ